jgi:hypothetical protein
MAEVTFYRTTASYTASDGLYVQFQMQLDTPERIQIAKEHLSCDDAGHIGTGWT